MRNLIILLIAIAVLFLTSCASGQEQFKQGMSHFSNSQWQLAIDSFTKAIEADSKLSEAYYYRAKAYKNAGDSKKAKNDFELYIKIEAEKTGGTNAPLTPETGEMTPDMTNQINSILKGGGSN